MGTANPTEQCPYLSGRNTTARPVAPVGQCP